MHVAAAACWAGGLALLVPLCLLAGRDHDQPWAREAVASFARIAVPALAVSVLSGALMARGLVPSAGGLSDTTYGRSLALKLGLVVLAVGLGASTAWRARRPAPDRRLGRRLVGEMSPVAVILLIAAALAGGQPPDDRRWMPSPVTPPTTSAAGAEAEDLLVTMAVSPGSPGRNFATVRVLDSRRPAPATVQAVLVGAGNGGPVPAERQSDTDWLVPLVLDRSGPLTLTVTVQRPGWADVGATFLWQVAPVPGTEQGGSDISGGWLALAAAGVTAGLCVGALAAWLGRRPRDDVVDEAAERVLTPV
jgi:copper transport protein